MTNAFLGNNIAALSSCQHIAALARLTLHIHVFHVGCHHHVTKDSEGGPTSQHGPPHKHNHCISNHSCCRCQQTKLKHNHKRQSHDFQQANNNTHGLRVYGRTAPVLTAHVDKHQSRNSHNLSHNLQQPATNTKQRRAVCDL